MDKLKPAIDAIKKYHFWVLCGVLVLTVVACWWMSTSGLAGQFDTQQSKIISAFSGLNSIQPGHPNQKIIDEIKNRDGQLKETVYGAWETLHSEQKKKNPFPTEELGEDFKRQFETLRPGGELARRYRERYQNFIKERLPKLKLMIDALHPVEPKPGEAASRPGGGEMGAIGGMGSNEVEWIGVVDWNEADYQKLESRFYWQQTPTTLAVVLAQEDLWVYEAMLRVIENTNEGATNQSNAAVKRIDSLEIGRDAVTTWKGAENALGLQGVGKTGDTMGSDMGMQGGDMGMQGGDMGMQGGGGFDEMGGSPGTGGAPEEQLNRQIMEFRYIDDKGKPLAYQPQYPFALHPRSEFKMMPISMKLVIDQRRIPRLLVECANSNMPIEVRRIRMLKTQGPAGSTTTGGGGFGGMGGGGMEGGMPGGGMGAHRPRPMGGTDGQQSGSEQYNVPVEIHAIINIYNPPDKDKLGKGAASTGQANGASAPVMPAVAAP